MDSYDPNVSPDLRKPLRTHTRAVAEIAMAAYGAPTSFRIAGEWVHASQVLGRGLEPMPTAMLLPGCREYALDRDAWEWICQRHAERNTKGEAA